MWATNGKVSTTTDFIYFPGNGSAINTTATRTTPIIPLGRAKSVGVGVYVKASSTAAVLSIGLEISNDAVTWYGVSNNQMIISKNLTGPSQQLVEPQGIDFFSCTSKIYNIKTTENLEITKQIIFERHGLIGRFLRLQLQGSGATSSSFLEVTLQNPD